MLDNWLGTDCSTEPFSVAWGIMRHLVLKLNLAAEGTRHNA